MMRDAEMMAIHNSNDGEAASLAPAGGSAAGSPRAGNAASEEFMAWAMGVAPHQSSREKSGFAAAKLGR